MTEAEFLDLVATVHPAVDQGALDVPLEDAALDSLDLLTLRSTLEVKLGRNLTVEKFHPRTTLRDLYRLCTPE